MTGTALEGPASRTERAASQSSVTELFIRWQQCSDESAREQLVVRFMPLAKKLARRYRGAREPLEDLEQVASVGLVKAIDRYDPDRGIAFQSFAVPTILGELKRYFRDCGWAVHVPRGTQERALEVERAQRTLAAKTGRAPTFNELAEYLELSIEDVLDAAEASAAHHSVSLESPHDDGEGEVGTLADTIGRDDERFETIDCRASIREAAVHLPERERQVLALKFLDELTQTQIAERIGVSQMQVSRIMRRALDRLSAEVEKGG